MLGQVLHDFFDELQLAGAGLALSLTTAYAAEGAAPATPAKAPTAQQSKMATCNTEAGDKKGDERKAFMSECLKK